MLAANSSPVAEKPLTDQELDAHRVRVRDLSNAHAKNLAGKRLVRKDPRLREIFETAGLAEKLKGELAAAEARAADFDASTGRLRNELLAVESLLASANASIGTYQIEAKTSAEALAGLRAQLASAEKSLAEAGARIGDLEKSEAAAKAENVANLALLDAATAELVKARADLTAALKKSKPAGGQ